MGPDLALRWKFFEKVPSSRVKGFSNTATMSFLLVTQSYFADSCSLIHYLFDRDFTFLSFKKRYRKYLKYLGIDPIRNNCFQAALPNHCKSDLTSVNSKAVK
jgi:hypothetical protein